MQEKEEKELASKVEKKEKEKVTPRDRTISVGEKYETQPESIEVVKEDKEEDSSKKDISKS